MAYDLSSRIARGPTVGDFSPEHSFVNLQNKSFAIPNFANVCTTQYTFCDISATTPRYLHLPCRQTQRSERTFLGSTLSTVVSLVPGQVNDCGLWMMLGWLRLMIFYGGLAPMKEFLGGL